MGNRLQIQKVFVAMLISTLWVIMPLPAAADTADTYLNITCMADLNYFSLQGITISDADKVYEQKNDSSEFIVFRSLTNPYICELKNHVVRVTMEYHPVTNKPPYDLDWGTFSIFFDDKLIENIGVGRDPDFILSMYSIDSKSITDNNILFGNVCDLNTISSRGCVSFDYKRIPVTFLNQY